MRGISKSMYETVQSNALARLFRNANKSDTQATIWLIDNGYITIPGRAELYKEIVKSEKPSEGVN